MHALGLCNIHKNYSSTERDCMRASQNHTSRHSTSYNFLAAVVNVKLIHYIKYFHFKEGVQIL